MSSFFPVAAAGHAAAIDGEMMAIHGLMAMLFMGWCMYLAWVIFRFRAGNQPEPLPVAAKGTVAVAVTGGVVVFEAVMLVFVALPMWRARITAPPPAPNAVAVRVVAQQYQWNFHYPGADGQFGDTRPALVTAENPVGLDRTSPHAEDDIVAPIFHVPINRQVVVQLTSKDVIHSFGLPNFRIKQDVVPGMVATVWFTPTLLGQFDIACSQICGVGHYQMRGIVQVDTEEAYTQFLADEAALIVK